MILFGLLGAILGNYLQKRRYRNENEQFLEKVELMIPLIAEFIREKAEGLHGCGAVDFEDYADGYLLPKIFICAVLREIEAGYRPYDKQDQKTINNIGYFL